MPLAFSLRWVRGHELYFSWYAWNSLMSSSGLKKGKMIVTYQLKISDADCTILSICFLCQVLEFPHSERYIYRNPESSRGDSKVTKTVLLKLLLIHFPCIACLVFRISSCQIRKCRFVLLCWITISQTYRQRHPNESVCCIVIAYWFLIF